MDATEAIAVIILIIAIVILVYYYLLNSPSALDKLRGYVPSSANAHLSHVLNTQNTSNSISNDGSESESMTNRIKVKLSDIDMSSLNTDVFSKKIDSFLDAKSDELIQNWSLATLDDLESLESKFSETTSNVDNLENEFNEFKKVSEEFQKSTQDKLDDLDKRMSVLEDK